jgi:hypothetical protein
MKLFLFWFVLVAFQMLDIAYDVASFEPFQALSSSLNLTISFNLIQFLTCARSQSFPQRSRFVLLR